MDKLLPTDLNNPIQIQVFDDGSEKYNHLFD